MPVPVVSPRLGLPSAIGLVAASMIGSGVFVTSGFLAKDLDAAAIMIAWLVGGGLAACGAICYAAVATHLPRSGGEYRYLHDLYHPLAGYLAGWITLLFGFAAPVAMTAMAAGAYAEVLWGKGLALPVSLGLTVGLSLLQGLGRRWGELLQNLGVALKLLTILVFLAGAALWGGLELARAWPVVSTWPRLGSGAFATGQIYLGYAFAGWSAASYLASEVRAPERNVPRAMLLGCALVTVIYMLLNLVFVTALTPAQLQAVAASGGSLTLGHLVATRMLGPGGAMLASGMIFLVLVSAVCAMTMTGPRVCDAMARDGLLPAWLRWRSDALGGLGPVGFMGGLATLFLVTNTYEPLLNAVGVTLAICGALSASAVLRLPGRRVRWYEAIALALYLGGMAWSVVGSLQTSPSSAGWTLLTLVLATGGYLLTRRRGQGLVGAGSPPAL